MEVLTLDLWIGYEAQASYGGTEGVVPAVI